MDWQIENCILKLNTDKKKCDGCKNRHFTCPVCGGPVYREGSYGEGAVCFHCSYRYMEEV